MREFVDNLAPSIPYCGTLAWDGYYKRCELKPRSRVLFDNCNAGRKILLVMPDDHKWLYELKKWTKCANSLKLPFALMPADDPAKDGLSKLDAKIKWIKANLAGNHMLTLRCG